MESSAIFSVCGKYRYQLLRRWDTTKPLVVFIGLNPSTANETKDDPTIRRVKKMAENLGYGGVVMMNLFAFVTAYPEELKACADPLNWNDTYLKTIQILKYDVIFAWGAFDVKDRAAIVAKMFPNAKALIINKDGSPRHPLYVPANTQPIPYQTI